MKKNSNRLEKAVDAIVLRLDKAEDFVLTQAPDICKEIIAELQATTIFMAIVNIVIVAFALQGVFFFISFINLESDDKWPYFVVIILGLVSLFYTIFTLEKVNTLISVRTAPKLTILRELKDLVKEES